MDETAVFEELSVLRESALSITNETNAGVHWVLFDQSGLEKRMMKMA